MSHTAHLVLVDAHSISAVWIMSASVSICWSSPRAALRTDIDDPGEEISQNLSSTGECPLFHFLSLERTQFSGAVSGAGLSGRGFRGLRRSLAAPPSFSWSRLLPSLLLGVVCGAGVPALTYYGPARPPLPWSGYRVMAAAERVWTQLRVCFG